MDKSFGKKEKLKSSKLIEKVFFEGKTLKKYPLRMIYIPLSEGEQLQFGVSVPKKLHKKAVDRIRLKRRMRESIRQNKHLLGPESNFAMMFVYITKETTSYSEILSSITYLFRTLSQKEVKNISDDFK